MGAETNGASFTTRDRLTRIELLLEKQDDRLRKLENRSYLMLGIFVGTGVLSGGAFAAILRVGT